MAIDHTIQCASNLNECLDRYVLPLPGDWATWYYTKKLIAQMEPMKAPSTDQ